MDKLQHSTILSKPTGNDELQHHGILGMKWGVRRDDAQLGKASGGKSGFSIKRKPKAEKPMSPTRKIISEMSDTDLRARLNRLQMEDQYKNLVEKMAYEPPSKAKAFVSKSMSTFGGMLVATMSARLAKNITAGVFDKKEKKNKTAGSDAIKNVASSLKKKPTPAPSSDDWTFKSAKEMGYKPGTYRVPKIYRKATGGN